MLVFNFRNETAGREVIPRPRLTVQLATDTAMVTTGSALLDSGADRTVVPDYIADVMNLKKGTPVESTGIGGMTRGFESAVDITFIDANQRKETVKDVPVYVLPRISDVVIGRRKIFEEFRVTFEQFTNRIILEKK